jgi:hypothetical protein
MIYKQTNHTETPYKLMCEILSGKTAGLANKK